MTTEIAKIDKFQQIGDELIFSMTSEIVTIKEDLEKKYSVDVIPKDLSVKESYDLVTTAIREIKKPRIALEKDRKAISSVPFNLCKQINAAAKPINDALVELEGAWKGVKTEYDERVELEKAEALRKEQDRIDAIESRIDTITKIPFRNMSESAANLSLVLAEVIEVKPEEWAAEYIIKASAAIADTVTALENIIAGKNAQEEVFRLQQEEARKIEDDRLAAEAKAQADREEQDRKNKDEAERLEKLQADIDAKQEAARIEAARIAKIGEERIAAERESFEAEKAALQAEKDKIQAEKDAAVKVAADRLAEEKQKMLDEEAAELASKEFEEKLKAKFEAKKIADRENSDKCQGAFGDALEGLGNCSSDFYLLCYIIDGKVANVTFSV